jgi:hypothetical protein
VGGSVRGATDKPAVAIGASEGNLKMRIAPPSSSKKDSSLA